MRHLHRPTPPAALLASLLAACAAVVVTVGQEVPRDGTRFRTSVDMVNVTATVSDESGRAVTGLTREDFLVLEDGRPQEISYFENERVPVSLGLAIDTSGSMEGEKIEAARDALDRFLFDLLGPEDEVFLYRISDRPALIEGWTRDRRRISQALRRIAADGGTALHDTVALAAPLAQTGAHRKKALVVISDGNDTNSDTPPEEMRRVVRQTEVIVYAVGIDGRSESGWTASPPRWPRQPPIIEPFPIPGRRQPPWFPPGPTPPQFPPTAPGAGSRRRPAEDGLNLAALRAITDDTGGRTEVVRGPRDLGPATARIAAELNQQYSLGYVAVSPKDGRWHDVDVQVRNAPHYTVRHRRGYQAQP